MHTIVSSSSKTVTIGDGHTRLIGERINPTGRKKLTAALVAGDLDLVRQEAINQVEAGADLIDVNVGAAGVDEVALLPEAVRVVMAAVDAPLSIDTANPAALQAALEVYEGRALVNSVNGKEKSLDEVLPLIAAYDAAVIGLTMDDDGIPNDPEQRLAIATKIVERAEALGIGRERLLIDCLAMTVGADWKASMVTLQTIRMVKEQLGVNLALGASNVSYGLPDRETINRAYLPMVIMAGVSCPIVNVAKVRDVVLATDLLLGRDEFAMNYIQYFRARQA